MTLTRWKLMAGVLGLSLCGLAALAEPACRTVGYAQRKPDDKPLPLPEPGGKPLPPPVEVTPPTPGPLPLPPPAVLPKADAPPANTAVPPPGPLPLPKAETLPPPVLVSAPAPAETKPLPLPEPKAAVSGGLDEKAFTEMAKQSLKLPDLPKLDGKKDEAKPLPLPAAEPANWDRNGDVPPAATTPGFNFNTAPPAPTLPTPKLDVTPLPVPGSPSPTPVPAVPVKAEVPVATPGSPLSAPPPPAPRAVEATPVSAAVPADRKLKVQLHLSSGKPWFEVRDGDELVLKVVSDAVEVKAQADTGAAASVLKASGGVSFRTLGGNGTCDELQVIPGSGEVVVSGKVAVTSNWGKAETTATAEKMTFRLGGEVAVKK
jgi:hypothetical protein